MKYLITLIVIVLTALGLFIYFRLDNKAVFTPAPVATSTPVTTTDDRSDLIRVTFPQANVSVRSPLTVTGQARGNWYFEASFPVRVLDANNKLLGTGIAEAQGDWMTTEFVPFSTIISFASSTTATGTLVLEKDNPSGLPEHDNSLRIPIRFESGSQVATRSVKLYFYNSNLDKDASGNVICSAKGLVPVNRTIPLTNTPIQDAVRELLKGPTTAERAQLSGTEYPLPGLTLTSASLTSGVLTLTFSDPQGKTTGGSCRVGVLSAQIEATAKQFGGVSTVRYAPMDSLFQP
ncbi:MAG: Gmad2 immunoglobulin-like domain-containing protein [Patescibacteria group bacterium]